MRTTFTGVLMLLLLALPTVTSSTAIDGTPPRNIILMIADGCGFNHVRAGQVLDRFASGRAPASATPSHPLDARLSLS